MSFTSKLQQLTSKWHYTKDETDSTISTALSGVGGGGGKKITVKVDEDIISSNVEVMINVFKESFGSETIISASPLGFFSLGSLMHSDNFYIPANFARKQSVNSKNFFVMDFNIPSDIIDYVSLNIYVDVQFSIMKNDTSYTFYTYPMPVIIDPSSYSPDKTEYVFGDVEENNSGVDSGLK